MSIFDIFSSNDEHNTNRLSANAANKGLDDGFDFANKKLTKANEVGQGFLDQSIAPFTDQLDRANRGMNYYDTLAGLNGGQAGYDALTDSVDYRASRGGAQQGLDSIARIRNGSGMLFSGNTLTDAMDYMHKYDTDILGNARGALKPYFDLGQDAAQGIQSGFNNKADLNTGIAGKIADYGWQKETGSGNNLANMHQANQAADNATNQNWWSAINSGLQTAAMFSDRRLKQHIKQVGTLDNGLPVYLFQYKHGGPFQIGLMAQDVEKVNPDAVSTVVGVKMVNYQEAAV